MRNILEFAVYAIIELEASQNYADDFVRLRMESFRNFHNGIIISSSHGAGYFQNVVKAFINKDYLETYYEKDPKKRKDNYEHNFYQLITDSKSKFLADR